MSIHINTNTKTPAAMMEELNQAISELSIINETGRSEMGSIDSELTHEEVSLNEEVFTEPPTTSDDDLETHLDKETPLPHPMLLDPVLECVFTHFINDASSTSKDIVKDVRNFRLVCKIWRDEVTRLYRRIQAPTIFGKNGVHQPLPELKAFLEIMENSDMIPVQRYRFSNDFFSNDSKQKLLKKFLLTCGSNIVSLSLQFFGQHAREFDLTGLANVKLEKLKNLGFVFESMDFDCYQVRAVKTHGLVLLLGLLLNSAEGLKAFMFDYQNGSSLTKPYEISIEQQFREVICRELSKNVKLLLVPNSLLDETSFNTLTMKGLKLEEFRIDVCADSGFHEHEPAIRKFLEKHANTMKTLRMVGMIGGIIPDTFKFVFPRLNEVRYLDMKGMTENVFSFTQTFPKVRGLDVDRWDRKAQLATTISKHFPNITELRISPDSKYCGDATSALREVFIHFPNIEQLYISMSLPCNSTLDADTLFSGVSKDGRKRIKEANYSKEIFREEQKMPSILNLTKLKKLEVKHDPSKGRYHLTDFSAYFVFLQMANLKELSLSMANISPKYVKRLEEKLNLSWRQRDMRWTLGRTSPQTRMEALYRPLRELK